MTIRIDMSALSIAHILQRIEAKYEKRIPLITKKYKPKIRKKKHKSRSVYLCRGILHGFLSSVITTMHIANPSRISRRKWNPKRLIERRLMADDYVRFYCNRALTGRTQISMFSQEFYSSAKLQRKIILEPVLATTGKKKSGPHRWVPPGSPQRRPRELMRVD